MSANVNPSEINKFSAIAAKWWDPNGEFKPLHDINPLRLQWLIEMAGDLNQKKILDVGCGGGIYAESMALKGGIVKGIDMAERSLQTAQLHRLESKIDKTQLDYQKIPVEDLAKEQANTYDIVTCMEMLEHVPDPVSIMKACFELVKPNGWVLFSTLNRTPKAFFMAIMGAEYLMKLLPKGTHQYETFIKPGELAEMARIAGLTPVAFKGISYRLVQKDYVLSDNTSVNYMMMTQKR
ncbi:bifunctional 2-polyprenyl-6-hydroxyphenol methylase/3-demethylubiquinol 3-O-methyltransferase UbiG [Basilea psittacipulmonis]|uniref:Ubiquinone biosynthesis O-methyltransferase n=1 Tax=Basilea psittacipulmonis DSM 24701 TaxID=1072685 RepID=A0A077DHD4_9BURK|nr:bifunctional 2-polyprenyl-6-hydroxyphenol methylase/3-demethylubiquinol 3-O-methyltransferase UbiG [Basilea psittacipulmonis]AIL32922.1 3-demethylubiquinone-9 3-methyltransferase [Basilea psittacipulmonis DSM 24701]